MGSLPWSTGTYSPLHQLNWAKKEHQTSTISLHLLSCQLHYSSIVLKDMMPDFTVMGTSYRPVRVPMLTMSTSESTNNVQMSLRTGPLSLAGKCCDIVLHHTKGCVCVCVHRGEHAAPGCIMERMQSRRGSGHIWAIWWGSCPHDAVNLTSTQTSSSCNISWWPRPLWLRSHLKSTSSSCKFFSSSSQFTGLKGFAHILGPETRAHLQGSSGVHVSVGQACFGSRSGTGTVFARWLYCSWSAWTYHFSGDCDQYEKISQ